MRIGSTIRSLSRRSLGLALAVLALSAASFGQFRVTITLAPPALPLYEEPICPGDGYIWTPGYWTWDDDVQGYYWVPGTWVLAPEIGFLWTPPWWGWEGGAFIFHEGWWGPEVGFYGGINYGFGDTGTGFWGGRWLGNHFFYNRSTINVNVTNIHYIYYESVNTVAVSHVSYNGGEGGITARPTPQQEAAARGKHLGPVAAQVQHVQTARSNPQLRASANQGMPPIAATTRPGEFSGAKPARQAGAPYHPPTDHAGTPPPRSDEATNSAHPAPAVHPKDLPPVERHAPPSTGDTKLDKKYQQQQEKLSAQQDRERQQLQQKQEQEHQRLEQQKASPEQTQQVEQKHQQQTQQLQQKHTQQQQNLQSRQAPGKRN
jgi:hypothetical protein